MATRPAVVAWLALALGLAGCLPARTSSPSPAPPDRGDSAPLPEPHATGAELSGARTDAPEHREEEPPPGVFHRILKGQTLYTISRTYGVALEEVVRANGISDPNRIGEGSLLFIPGATRLFEVPITVPPRAERAGLFVPPVDGPINSRFGRRHGRMHYGLDFGVPDGTEVRASRKGVVLYAGGDYEGYGKLIILDHGDGYQSLYAHNDRLLTRTGKTVDASERIARSGSSGNASGPHLHFEIRKENRPLDPALFLPPNPTTAARR